MKLRALSILVGLLVALFGASSPAAAKDTYALGGGSTLPNKPVLSLALGQSVPNFTRAIIQNSGSQPADVAYSPGGVPAGVSIRASDESFTLQPGEQRDVQLSASADSQAIPGTYKIVAQFRQKNVPKSDSGTVVFAPAVDINFTLDVVGETGTARVTAVAEGSNSALTGKFSILTEQDSGRGIPVASAEGTEVVAQLAPGAYTGLFEITGLASESTDFEVIANQNTDVVIPVKAVSFFLTAAKPNPPSGEPISVELVSSVRNDIQPVTGPVAIQVAVKHDGEQIEVADLASLDVLKSGLTDAKATYVPAGGWQPGTYSFVFQVVAPDFTVEAPDPPTLEISWWTTTRKVIAGLVLVAIVGSAVWFIRRRRVVIG